MIKPKHMFRTIRLLEENEIWIWDISFKKTKISSERNKKTASEP